MHSFNLFGTPIKTTIPVLLVGDHDYIIFVLVLCLMENVLKLKAEF